MRWRPLLALFSRALRVDARSVLPYSLRCLVLFLVLAMLSLYVANQRVLGAPGHSLWVSLCWMNFVCILIAGPGLFASVISDERTDGTLPLLRLTDLDPVAILAGTSGSRQLSAVLLLIVQLPFAFLSVTLGGVAPAQLLWSFLALGAFLILVANIALFVSVTSKNTRHAASATLSGIFLCLIWHALLMAWLRKFDTWLPDSWEMDLLAGLESHSWAVMGRLRELQSVGFAGGLLAPQFWIDLALAAMFFGLAWLVLWAQPPDRTRAVGTGPPRFFARRRPRPRPGAGRALAWKDSRFVMGGKRGLLARVAVYTALCIILYMTGLRDADE